MDSPTSGYATVLYQILKDKAGLEKDKDYKVISVGGTGARVKSLKENTAVVAIISSPNDVELQAEGFNILGDAAVEIGDYQGSAYAVRKSWAKANENLVLAFVRATVAATDYVFSDKAGTVEVLQKRIKNLSAVEAGKIYDRLIGPGGLNKGATLNTKGVSQVLKLRSIYGKAGDHSRAIPPSTSTSATTRRRPPRSRLPPPALVIHCAARRATGRRNRLQTRLGSALGSGCLAVNPGLI